jgi:hypothetical protein
VQCRFEGIQERNFPYNKELSRTLAGAPPPGCSSYGALPKWPCALPVSCPGASRLAHRGLSLYGLVRGQPFSSKTGLFALDREGPQFGELRT